MNKIWLLYKKEFKETIRDRSVLISNFLFPILSIPLIFIFTMIASGFIAMNIEEKNLNINIYINGKLPEGLLTDILLKKILVFKEFDESTLKFNATPEEITKFSKKNNVDAVIILTKTKTSEIYQIYTDSSKTANFIYINELKNLLEKYSQKMHQEKLKELKLDKDNIYPIQIKTHDRATLISMAKNSFSGQAGIVLVILLIIGMYYPAINAIIGEKDKKTMDVLILASNNETNILVAKLLNIITFGLLTFIPYLFDYLLIKIILGKEVIEQYSIFSFDNIFIFTLNFICLTFVIGSICIFISILSRTTSRAQSMLSGLFMILMIPIIFLTVIDKKMSLLMSMVPIMNFFYLLRDIILGQVNFAGSILSASVNFIFFLILLKYSLKYFNKRYVLKV